MGYEIEQYPHPLLTALVSTPQSLPSFLSTLQKCQQLNTDSLITPIFPDTYLLQHPSQINLDKCFIISDEHIKKNKLNIITPLINDCIWGMPVQFRRKFVCLLIGYATYLNLRFFAFYFRGKYLQQIVQTFADGQVMKELRKCSANLTVIVELSGEVEETGDKDDQIWRKYIEFRTELEKIKFPLYIELGLQVKPNAPMNRIINRWKSQKITYIITSTECFTQNSKGFVILPSKHQRIILQLLILKGLFSLKINQQPHRDIQQYYKYILYIFRKHAQNKLRSQKDAINLQDVLQNPLQPYADNLQSATYQVFQFDSQKYDQYQVAIQDALDTFPKNKKVVIYYIGSGRGGLLFNVFAAAKKAQRKVFVYAIEKNLYPIQTIKKRLKQNNWENHVKIVHTDIRDYQMPQKPDIFLSELLGGFGDNELSPECLYWAEKNIDPSTICIPTDYTSYIRPVSYQSIHRKLNMSSRQIYYTVYYGNYYTNFPCQYVWKFSHPLPHPQPQPQPQPTTTNPSIQQPMSPGHHKIFTRHSTTTFTSKQDIIINGFAGYFTSSLYKHSELSILPEKPTFGMYSWYPLFFSFIDAEFVGKGEILVIDLWRKYTDQKVWYQWRYQIGNRKQSIVHNQDGAFVAIQI